MPANGDSLAERVQSSYLQLSSVASDLNTVSDELGKSIAEIDLALKKLNLGVSVWVDINEWEDDLDYYKEQLGYAKIDGKWGIALRTVSGNLNWPDRDEVEQWLFSDAPRRLRLAAIETLPDMLKSLSDEAVETTSKIKGKLAEAKEVAAAVKGASEGRAKPGSDLSALDQMGRLRNAVLRALADGNQRILVSMLQAGRWSLRANELVIAVAESQTVVDMSVGSDARSLAIAAASGILGRAVELRVVSGANDVAAAKREQGKHGGSAGLSAREQKK
jgi:hypothetical protein